MDTIADDSPELIQVIRTSQDQFYEKLPETIIKTLDYIRHNGLSKREYR